MMTTWIAALLLAGQAAAPPAPGASPAATQGAEAASEAALQKAVGLIRAKQPQAALDALEPALARFAAERKGDARRVYCGASPTEAILYAGMAAKDKANAVIAGPNYCTALFLKGFALVDLNRAAEAKETYRELLTHAPMNGQYLTEYAQLLGRERDWDAMLSTCGQAEAAADLAPDQAKTFQKTAALRCQGYALVEQHKLDEAQKRYEAALKVDPADAKSQGELRYIAEQRAKATARQ